MNKLIPSLTHVLAFLLAFLYTTSVLGQIKAKVLNSQTNEGIPYVNIWVDGEDIGTTSAVNGDFQLDNVSSNKDILVSAIGFEIRKICVDLITNSVQLKPQLIELNEVMISSKKLTKEISVGSFKKSRVDYSFACGTKPYIVARYFEFKNEYNETPFLKKISILTKSNVNDAKFIIRLYSINEIGEPGNFMNQENIYGIAKKGKNITEIELSSLNIQFPENGFFVAIEWLIIDANKYEITYTSEGSKGKKKGLRYDPSIITVPSEMGENSQIFSKGNWTKFSQVNGSIKKYKNKDSQLAIELVLTN